MSQCSQRGQSCTFFNLVRVEFSDLSCQLQTGKIYEITFTIQGQRPQNRSSAHKLKLEVIEQGKTLHVAEFAEQAKQVFHPGYSQETYYISSGGSTQKIFLVKKINQALNGQLGIVIDCKLSHGYDANSNNWCHDHQVSLLIKL